jgi:hypothetical protein
MIDMKAQIADELYKALERLGAGGTVVNSRKLARHARRRRTCLAATGLQRDRQGFAPAAVSMATSPAALTENHASIHRRAHRGWAMIKREHKERTMCDYSLRNVRSRPAAVGDNLVTHDFGTGTRGFAASENVDMAVCLLPGTEIAFPNGIQIKHRSFFGWPRRFSGKSTSALQMLTTMRSSFPTASSCF